MTAHLTLGNPGQAMKHHPVAPTPESTPTSTDIKHDFCIRLYLANGHTFIVVVSAINKFDAFRIAGLQTSYPVDRFSVMWESEVTP